MEHGADGADFLELPKNYNFWLPRNPVHNIFLNFTYNFLSGHTAQFWTKKVGSPDLNLLRVLRKWPLRSRLSHARMLSAGQSPRFVYESLVFDFITYLLTVVWVDL